MKKLTLLLILAVAIPVAAQDSNNDTTFVNSDSLLNAGLDQLMSYMLFTRDDFTFRDDYMPKDPYRLKIVDSLMKHPLLMDDFGDSCAAELLKFNSVPDSVLIWLFNRIGNENIYKRNEIEFTVPVGLKIKEPLNYYINPVYDELNLLEKYVFDAMGEDWESEKNKFIMQKYKEFILDDPDYRVWTNEQLDSIQQIEEEWTKYFAESSADIPDHWFDRVSFVEHYIGILMDTLNNNPNILKRKVGKPLFEFGSGKFKIIIGTTANDTYTGDYFMIIDPGGDDVYNISYDIENPHPTLIVDYSGNDIYKAETDFALASGALSYSLLIDYEGDDIYWGKNFSLGSGYFGVGILWDKKGNDKYFGDTFVQGAGTFGLGLLIDEDGSDTYTCHFQSQGFGFVRGVGGIADFAGNDTYTVQPKYKEFFHPGDHYQSLSQGFAIGVRPYMSGGFGFICDYGGNDSYIADFFAQGSGYWWSLGMLWDKSGNDLYASYQYAQGAGAHMALGLLLDGGGDDIYRSNGVCQGCGHDYSCGWLLDRGGNDVYSAQGLAHGAGQANGIGIFTDLNGNDGNFTTDTHNTQGYGNPRRDYGSIGLFLDMDGDDRYGANGGNGRFWKVPGKWGGGLDLKKIELPTDTIGGK
ncbi:MAG: hypothetical protein ABIE07_10980 [Candidatus Zixiibacteriota bacterium]